MIERLIGDIFSQSAYIACSTFPMALIFQGLPVKNMIECFLAWNAELRPKGTLPVLSKSSNKTFTTRCSDLGFVVVIAVLSEIPATDFDYILISTPTSLPTQLYFLLTPIKANLIYPNILGCVALHTYRKLTLFFSSSLQSPCWELVWLQLAQVLHTRTVTSSVSSCAPALLCPEDTVSL